MAPRKPKAPKAPPAERDAFREYAERVIAGELAAGRLVRLACERHLRDLEHGAARGLRFDVALAGRAIEFFGYLNHSKGEWAGTPIKLELWQQFVIGSIFGWLRGDGSRRFRTTFNFIPRKNGKSTVAAGIGLYCLVLDKEPGAEVYAIATKKDQAKIVWSEAERMVQASPALRKRIQVQKNNLSIVGTASKFEPLSAEDQTQDGLNAHCYIADEIHAHPTRGLIDVLDTSMGARRQPLAFDITTAGIDRNSICGELYDHAVKVLEGVIDDDAFFAYVCQADEGDEIDDPRTWAKANPNLGVSIKEEYLAQKAKEARERPGYENTFRRLHLNQWVTSERKFIGTELWLKNDHPLDEVVMVERECFGGLDLSATTDLSALVLLFPPVDIDPVYRVICRFWIPERSLERRKRREQELLRTWINHGFLIATPGDVVDYDAVREEARQLSERYLIREIAFDPWNATQLSTNLQNDGFTMVSFRQGYASMSPPTKELSRLLLAGSLSHASHPVLTWMASNVSVTEDPAGNLKPDKGKSSDRIDGIVALIMALGRASAVTGTGGSGYETEDLFFLGGDDE